MAYPKFPEPLDADEPLGKTYTFRIVVGAGDAVTSAATLEVEPTSTQAPEISLVTISQQSLGLISPGIYGMTFRAQGKGTAGTTFVRCRFQTQLGAGDDVTYQLQIKQR